MLARNRRGEIMFPTPVNILVEMFNGLGSEYQGLKEEFLAYVKSYKEEVDHKGHVAEGFALQGDKLAFHDRLWDEAVYRGKIDTYEKSLLEAIEELESKARSFSSMVVEHKKALGAVDNALLSTRVCSGKPLSIQSRDIIRRLDSLSTKLPDK